MPTRQTPWQSIVNKQSVSRFIQPLIPCVKSCPSFGKAFYGLGLAQLLQNEREGGCLSLKQARNVGYADAANAVAEYCE